jgi:hypothetical protein
VKDPPPSGREDARQIAIPSLSKTDLPSLDDDNDDGNVDDDLKYAIELSLAEARSRLAQ